MRNVLLAFLISLPFTLAACKDDAEATCDGSPAAVLSATPGALQVTCPAGTTSIGLR